MPLAHDPYLAYCHVQPVLCAPLSLQDMGSNNSKIEESSADCSSLFLVSSAVSTPSRMLPGCQLLHQTALVKKSPHEEGRGCHNTQRCKQISAHTARTHIFTKAFQKTATTKTEPGHSAIRCPLPYKWLQYWDIGYSNTPGRVWTLSGSCIGFLKTTSGFLQKMHCLGKIMRKPEAAEEVACVFWFEKVDCQGGTQIEWNNP